MQSATQAARTILQRIGIKPSPSDGPNANPNPATPTIGERLSPYCSLCGEGYHPNLEIEIAEEPFEYGPNSVHCWHHTQCKHDHDRQLRDWLEVGGSQ